ncbi:ATP-binding cassette domain-containing protein [Schleiferilactobacillus shenzhenensis]|uniref:ATP-binding cassette domain-containing protein n=1 Tax=Schleiferilactobacillus shenzhenensis TaxID=1231337 RepID=UPI0003FEDAD3|nr:ATP-binding cassette domain-containing protein [Schleiferilactobacillus shenzhenensis]
MFKELFRYGRAGRAGALQQMIDEAVMLLLPVAAAAVVLTWWTERHWSWGGLELIAGLLGVTGGYYLLPGARRRIQEWTVLAKREIRTRYLRGLFTPALVDDPALTSHQVIQRDLNGIARLDSFYGTFLPAICASGLVYAVLVVLAVAWHSWVALLPLLCMVLMGGGMMLLQKLSPTINRQYMQGFLKMGGRFLDDLGGMRTLVLFGAGERSAAAFAEDAEFFRGKTMALLKYQLQSLFVLNGVVFAGIGGSALLLAPAVTTGRLTLTQAGVLWLLLAQLLVFERRLGYFMHIIMSTRPALQNISRVISTGETAPAGPTDAATSAPITTVRFQDASFHYPDGQPLWAHVTLTLQPGRLIGLVGKNGSGKSTLAQILRGRLKITSGTVMFNDETATQLTPAEFTSHVAYLNDRPYLFSGTIGENIALGVPDQTGWWAQVQALGLCAFVEALPQGLATPVGENGRFLSPGQRQQIAFARLVLMAKDVYVFDEATANIDAENAQIMMTAMQRLSQTKIVLCITHEWQAIRLLDQINFLAQGRITTAGYSELAKDNPDFKRLLASQQGMEAAG